MTASTIRAAFFSGAGLPYGTPIALTFEYRLRVAFDPVLREPIPQKLAALLINLREQEELDPKLTSRDENDALSGTDSRQRTG